MKTINELFREVEFQNELSGNEKARLRFSDPDGPSGRSGWSFAVCQFDTKHNGAALACLRECGFTELEVQGVVAQDINVKALEHKLVEHADIIARYEEAQLSRCLYSAMNVATSNGIMITSTGSILCLADYINQYGSIGPGFIEYLNQNDLDGSVSSAEIQEWKLKHTDYGKKHPVDCERRYNTILKVLEDNKL